MTRNNNAYALVSIIALGAMTLAFLMALATIVQQASGTISQNKYDMQLLNAAEIGMDYAVSQFNTTNPCQLDPLTSGQQQISSPLNQELLPNELSSVQVTLTVKNIVNPSDWQSFQQLSSIYSRQLDPNKNGITKSWQNPVTSGPIVSGYRIIESQAARGGTSRTIRCFIQAQFTPQPGVTPIPQSAPGITTSYFANPMFSNGALVVAPSSGNLNVSSSPSSANPLTLNTNTQITVGPGANINANIQVLTALLAAPAGPGSNPTAAFLPSNPTQSNGVIDGRLTVNSLNVDGNLDPSVVSTPGATPNLSGSSPDNVYATIAGSPRTGLNNSAPSTSGPNAQVGSTNPSSAQIQIAPSPGASESNQSFPQITSELSNVPAGDYTANGLLTSSFTVPATMGAPQDAAGAAVRIFVQDNGSSNPIQINSSMMTNASGIDSNLQVFYGGSNSFNLNLNGASFAGTIYAPNATVNITGNGNFTGAIVAGVLSATNSGNIYIDNSLAGSTGPASAGLTYQANPSTQSAQIQGWQIVTWQELKP